VCMHRATRASERNRDSAHTAARANSGDSISIGIHIYQYMYISIWYLRFAVHFDTHKRKKLCMFEILCMLIYFSVSVGVRVFE